MAVHSNFLGSVTVSGAEAQALTRRLSRGRATKAATTAAENGKRLIATFSKKHTITIKLKPSKVLENA